MPIVALTAHDAATYKDACLAAGMDDLLRKPYTLDACAQVMGRWTKRADGFSSPPSESLASVDIAAVEGLRRLRADGHTDLYSKLVDLFQAGSARTLQQLALAFANNDLVAAAALCHKLAPSAANVGAAAFARDAGALQRLCAAGQGEARHASCTSASWRLTRPCSSLCGGSSCAPAHERRGQNRTARHHRRR